MSGGRGLHHHHLYRPGESLVHRLPPHCKLVAVLAFVLVVVSTPREQFWAFGGYAAMLAAVALLARIPLHLVARRMVVEVPFVAFAVLLPFVSRGPRVDVWGLALSQSGLLGAWNILAKATLGVIASILLAATTEPRSLLLGLERLHMPQLMVQIMQFMFRYAEVIGSEMHRMRIARESRAFQARNLRQVGVVAKSAGALFIRSYERGERVHLAMLSRGYSGSMPAIIDIRASRLAWAVAAVLPTLALAVAISAWLVPR
ncbi:MAG: cobalt ECF transporter T component CbiQ [Mycobacteriales bacterium]